jgi:ABC-type lipoprotein export system ATPase subunit
VLLPAVPLKDKMLKKAAEERAFRLLERVGLSDHMHRRPAMLSVGECQRAAVVRALVNSPKLLLADEPTGSLDASNARKLGQLLGELNREEQLAIVLVTHSPEIASCMGTTYRLHEGKLKPAETK